MKNNAIFTLTHPAGNERVYKSKDGSKGSHICIGNVGYVTGTAWALMALMLDGHTETESWQIVNVTDNQNNFLASVAVLGATGDEHAVNMALRTFNGDLGGYGQANAYEVVQAPAFVLKRLLDSDSRAAYKARITQDEVTKLYQKLTATPAQWKDTDVVSHGSVNALMSDMVRYDETRELQTPVTADQAFTPWLEGSEMGQYDAIVTQVSRLDNLSNRILVAMGKAADKVKPVEVTKTDPFKKHGVVNVAQHFTFDDGQSVMIVYHNPDSTPNKLDAKDVLTSWKFQLNGRDVTAALQPKSGKDVNIPQMAKRIMLLIEANSARFVRAQERKIKAEKALNELNQIEAEKREVIKALEQEIADLQAELDKPIGEYVADQSQGTIVGQKEKGPLTLGNKVFPRDADGNILKEEGKLFKTRVVADGVIQKLELSGYVVKAIAGGYVITELSDPTYKTNGYITVGNPLYDGHIVKAVPKLLFEYHNREFLVVESDVLTKTNDIEVIEMRGRASISSKDEKGKDQFFYNSVSTAYRRTLEVLAGMTQEQFDRSGVAKRKETDATASALIVEGASRQPEEILEERIAKTAAEKAAERKAQIDALRDENGRLNPLSDNPMERVTAHNEMSYQERVDFAETWINHTRKDKNDSPEERENAIYNYRKSIVNVAAGLSDGPDYLKANQDLYAMLKKELENNLDNPDTSIVASLKQQLQRKKDFLESKGIVVEEPQQQAAPQVTRYEIKDPNPRRRKAAGLVKLTQRPDNLFNVLLQQGTVGGEHVGDIDSVKRWLATRLQTMGDAMNDQANTWENIASQLKLTLGPDALGVDQGQANEDMSALPEGVTAYDLARRKELDSITKNIRAVAQEPNPRNLSIGGKSFTNHVSAMLALAEKLAEMPSAHTTPLDVADILQHELNQNSLFRQYCVVMPRLDRVTAGNVTNKLRRIDKAFKEAGAPITLRKGTSDTLLLSGDKPFSRVKFYFDKSKGDKPYYVMQADRMDGQEYGKLIDALLDYLNEDTAIERQRIYFSRNRKIIDTATNQLGDELKAKFQALEEKARANSANYTAEKQAAAQLQSPPSFKTYNEMASQYGYGISDKGVFLNRDGDEIAYSIKINGDTLEIKDVLGNTAFTGTAQPESLGIFFEDVWGESKLKTANQSGEELTLKEIRQLGLVALKNVKHFLSPMQHTTINGLIKRGEESQFYAEKMIELEKLIKNMPVTYQTDGQGRKAIAQLHYFRGNMDWYITEKDVEGDVLQAYGYVNAGHGLEGGYINIQEVTSVNAELDLYFTPQSIHAVEGTEPEETEDTTVTDNNEDAVYLDKILAGEINPQDVDMKDLEAMAVKYGSDQDSEIYTKLEKAVGVAISAKLEKAKAVK